MTFLNNPQRSLLFLKVFLDVPYFRILLIFYAIGESAYNIIEFFNIFIMFDFGYVYYNRFEYASFCFYCFIDLINRDYVIFYFMNVIFTAFNIFFKAFDFGF